MEHIGELFENRKEAILVSNALADEARVTSYVEVIGLLIRNPEFRRTLAFNAYALASHGRFSLERHSQQLSGIYDAAFNLAASTSTLAPPLRGNLRLRARHAAESLVRVRPGERPFRVGGCAESFRLQGTAHPGWETESEWHLAGA
jgi:hypothetical protein